MELCVCHSGFSLPSPGMFEIWAIMRKCTVVAKKELFYAWPFGLAAWLCGLIFIDRVNAGGARAAINKAAAIIKKDQVRHCPVCAACSVIPCIRLQLFTSALLQIKLWIFPEGTRKNTGEIHPFKKGAFHVAVSAQLPILPVVYSPYYFLDDRARILDSGKLIFSFWFMSYVFKFIDSSFTFRYLV